MPTAQNHKEANKKERMHNYRRPYGKSLSLLLEEPSSAEGSPILRTMGDELTSGGMNQLGETTTKGVGQLSTWSG